MRRGNYGPCSDYYKALLRLWLCRRNPGSRAAGGDYFLVPVFRRGLRRWRVGFWPWLAEVFLIFDLCFARGFMTVPFVFPLQYAGGAHKKRGAAPAQPTGSTCRKWGTAGAAGGSTLQLLDSVRPEHFDIQYSRVCKRCQAAFSHSLCPSRFPRRPSAGAGGVAKDLCQRRCHLRTIGELWAIGD